MIRNILDTMLKCFVMNGCDEIVPNEKWFKLSDEDKNHIRKLFGSENYQSNKKTFKARNGITYEYDTIEELCYILNCIQCPNEKRCHDNCETCDEYEEELEELEKKGIK